jgi:hypothetical protein
MHTLDTIVSLLDKHHQRATYGAVAGLLEKAPRSLMQGRKRDWRNSWIVNGETGLPGEYPEPMIHPAIRERAMILADPDSLARWLEAAGRLTPSE